MATPLAALFDKRRMAMTRARFRAWWEGADFDEEAALAAIEQDNSPEEPGPDAAAEQAEAVEEALFDQPEPALPARLLALSALWGADRIMPGDATAEALVPAQIGAAADGLLLVMGPGLAAPLVPMANAHAGPIAAFEWREETFVHLAAGLRRAKLDARVTATRIDLETHAFESESADGVWSLDEFTFADEPTRLAHHIARALKPGACAVVECYAGLPSPDIAPSFAAAFAEPQIRAGGDIAHFLIESGLKIEAQDDLTQEHVELARLGFKNLEAALKERGGLDVAVARELSWEAESWRARLKLLASQRLERRRIVARRPG